MIKISGSLCIISAPSGAGKSTLIQALQQHNFPSNIYISISYTTRSKRPDEINEKDYYFVSKKTFKHMIAQNMFFEYAKIFNHYYGTNKNNIMTMLHSGTHVILNIDWQGTKQIQNTFSKTNIYTIFILPPSQTSLEQRLRIRGQDTNQIINHRIKTAINEIKHCKKYDYIIINDHFDVALRQLRSIILSEQLRSIHQKIRHKKLIHNLMHSTS